MGSSLVEVEASDLQRQQTPTKDARDSTGSTL
jgi:hypothetical protein